VVIMILLRESDATRRNARYPLNQERVAETTRPLIRSATPSDLPVVLALLESRELPVAGVAERIGDCVLATAGGTIVGVAGLERYADGALLRSVAVAVGAAGQGIGQTLVATVLARAATDGTPAVWLLTTTAERWFPRFGFRVADRVDAPAGVAGSVEFREACPATAVAMVLDGEALAGRRDSRSGAASER
jgi:amino-acid N-acetyltransferase